MQTTVTKTIVAQIPFLNCAPFYRGLAGDEMELLPMTPRELGQRMAAGTVDAGVVPVAEFFRQQATLELLGYWGIATAAEARSVLLFSKWPIRQLDGATVGVTGASATSVVLLRLLLEHRFGVKPAKYVESNAAGHDAWLAIGDEALTRQSELGAQLPFTTDLGEEWWLWQGLPFVFAVWAVRKTLEPERKPWLAKRLQSTLNRNLTQRAQIAQEWSARLGLPAPALERYLNAITYWLGPREQEGMERFRQLAEAAKLL